MFEVEVGLKCSHCAKFARCIEWLSPHQRIVARVWPARSPARKREVQRIISLTAGTFEVAWTRRAIVNPNHVHLRCAETHARPHLLRFGTEAACNWRRSMEDRCGLTSSLTATSMFTRFLHTAAGNNGRIRNKKHRSLVRYKNSDRVQWR